ncbi:MAG: hypothetical protein PHQ52_07375 [Candidatus Omnitrophica bacterium]|nr:hypothetical protein [Candidatus Omnitrophota bacterium]
MKKYIHPKIKVIVLDPKQALVQVCKAGGVYLWSTNTTNIWCSTSAGYPGGPDCRYTPKGGAGGITRMIWTPNVCDSAEALPS